VGNINNGRGTETVHLPLLAFNNNTYMEMWLACHITICFYKHKLALGSILKCCNAVKFCNTVKGKPTGEHILKVFLFAGEVLISELHVVKCVRNIVEGWMDDNLPAPYVLCLTRWS
jgi:hypothetical protein